MTGSLKINSTASLSASNATPSTVAKIGADNTLTNYASGEELPPLSGVNLTGIPIGAIPSNVSTNPAQITLTHAGTVTLDLTAIRSQADFTGCTGAITFATANLVAAHDYVLFGRNTNASSVVPTFPAWRFQGGAPSIITGLKAFTISLSSRGTVDTNVWAAYSEEP